MKDKKRFWKEASILIVIIMMSTAFLPCCVQPLPIEWPTFHGNNERTGYSLSQAPDTGRVLWKFELPFGAGSSPVVADGKLVVGTWDGYVYCLDESSGNLVWKYNVGANIWCTPTITAQRVFIIAHDGYVYCFALSNGNLIWRYYVDDPDRKPVNILAYDDILYAGSANGIVCAIDIFEMHDANTPKTAWAANVTTQRITGISASKDKLFMVSSDHFIYCLDIRTKGSVIWKYQMEGEGFSIPAIGNGRVFFGSFDGNIYCLDENTGNCTWSYKTGDKIWGTPAIAYGMVFVGSDDSYIYALNAITGELVWKYKTQGKPPIVRSSPAVADGKVFVGAGAETYPPPLEYDPETSAAYVYAFDAMTGEVVWEYKTDWGFLYSSPAIANGKVFIVSHDCAGETYGYVYAFE